MVIWTLKLVMSAIVDDAVKVKVAATDCPGLSLVPSWFHVRVIGPFAVVGVQLLVPMLRARERPLPVFLT
jgi:hypothetical protein